jgi:hypothetical protein
MKKLFITLCAFLISGFAITANAQDLKTDLKNYVTAVDNCVHAYKVADNSADNSAFIKYLNEARGYRDSLKKQQTEMTTEQLELYKKTTEKLEGVDPQKTSKKAGLKPEKPTAKPEKPTAKPVKPEVKPAVKPEVKPSVKPEAKKANNGLQKELKEFETVVNKCVKAYKDSLVRDKSANKNVDKLSELLKDARIRRDALEGKQSKMTEAQVNLFKQLKEELAKVDTIK